MRHKKTTRRVFAFLPVVFASIATLLAVKCGHTGAANTSPTQVAVRKPILATASDERFVTRQAERPSPWGQLANFIKLSLPSSQTASVPDPDPDWSVTWQPKTGVNLEADQNPCSQSVAPFPPSGGPPSPSANALTLVKPQIPVQLASGNSQDCKGVVETVLYNQIAANRINGNPPLYDNNTFDGISQGKLKCPVKLPPGSVVVKELWEKINSNRVVVWDPANLAFLKKYITNPVITSWTTGVTLGSDPNQPCPAKLPIPGDQTSQGTPGSPQTMPIPRNCFVISRDNNYALVGLNIAHKSSDGLWYFYAFAWTNNLPSDSVCQSPIEGADPAQTRCGGMSNAGQPSYLAPWSHYVMNTTSQLEQPKAPGICFNPYLEGLKRGGAVTNCARCHQFAAYAPKLTPQGAMVQTQPVSWFTTQPTLGNSAVPIQAGQVSLNLKYYVPTDFLWSLVTKWEK